MDLVGDFLVNSELPPSVNHFQFIEKNERFNAVDVYDNIFAPNVGISIVKELRQP
jgi:hypothetical protein